MIYVKRLLYLIWTLISTLLMLAIFSISVVLSPVINIIVYVLVLFSGALSFVVFYSLAYINISERQREIATLKVLGFRDNESNQYI